MSTDAALAEALFARRAQFRAFLVSPRLGSEADAEDLLPQGLVRALAHAGDLRDEHRLVPWFYQLLRRAVIDHHRSRRAAGRREEAWTLDWAESADGETEDHLCRCFLGLVPLLKPAAELIRRVELGGELVASVARDLGITVNHAGVLLHRARRELRVRLTALCGDCSPRACLDCDCGERAETA